MSKWLDATEGSDSTSFIGSGARPERRPSTLLGAIPFFVLVAFSYWLWTEMPQSFEFTDRTVVNHKARTTRADRTAAASEASGSTDQSPTTQGQESERSAEASAGGAADLQSPSGDTSPAQPGNFGSEEEVAAARAEEAATKAAAEAAARLPPEGYCPLGWRPPEPGGPRPAELLDWYRDHTGYISALRRRSHVGRAMLLYFRTDSCPWAREFETTFLAHRPIANWVSEQIRVVIDAEGGLEESELIRKLKIEGFPALVVIPESPGPPVRLAPFPGGEALDTSEFLTKLKNAAR